MKFFTPHSRSGQSIMELIVAMAIGVILIVGAASAISPILKISSDVARIQSGAALGKELLENTRVLAEVNWHNIDSLATTSAHHYYVVATSSPFTVASGTEAVQVATTTYTRYFFLDSVYRNNSGQVDPVGSASDPSTEKVTVVYSWSANASNTIVSYLTRSHDEVFPVGDWSGGPNQAGPITATGTNSRFATSSNIDYTAHAGSIVITGF